MPRETKKSHRKSTPKDSNQSGAKSSSNSNSTVGEGVASSNRSQFTNEKWQELAHGPRSYAAGQIREDYGESRREEHEFGEEPGPVPSRVNGEGNEMARENMAANELASPYANGSAQSVSPYAIPGGLIPAFQRRADDEIEEIMQHALDNDPYVPAEADIKIDVTNGTVTLTGEVRSARVKRSIGEYAWHCPGVRDVNNEIRLIIRRRRTTDGNTSIGQEGDTNS